jgi:hypothetical protein
VYSALEKAAQANGTTPEGWIVANLPDQTFGAFMPSDEEIAQANAGLDEYVVKDDLGYERGGDNDSIDADLTRAYDRHGGLPPIPEK